MASSPTTKLDWAMEKTSALELHRLRYRERRAAKTTKEREQGYRVTKSGENTSYKWK